METGFTSAYLSAWPVVAPNTGRTDGVSTRASLKWAASMRFPAICPGRVFRLDVADGVEAGSRDPLPRLADALPPPKVSLRYVETNSMRREIPILSILLGLVATNLISAGNDVYDM